MALAAFIQVACDMRPPIWWKYSRNPVSHHEGWELVEFSEEYEIKLAIDAADMFKRDIDNRAAGGSGICYEDMFGISEEARKW